MILTPHQIEWYCGLLEKYDSETILAKGEPRTIAATLRAYAEIVEAVARQEPTALMHNYRDDEWGWVCLYCGGVDGHNDECPHARALELRGQEPQAQPQSDCGMLAEMDRKHSK